MSTGALITHAEALRLIDEQLGEQVYVGFLVDRADPADPEGPTPFIHSIGPLKNPLAPKPPRLEPDVGYYQLGSESFCFPPLTGTIHLRDNGVDFRVADTVSIRVAWRGSEEVGDRWSQPVDLTRLLATGRRARAEILEATPTAHKVAAGEEARRIWSLRLRVCPDDGPAFETMAEHGFQPSPDFEAKIEGGYSLNMFPENTTEVEVLYDSDDHRQVVLDPREPDGGLGGMRLRGIVGHSVNSREDDTPPPSPQ